ncbi:MAG TPA: class I SAM-dependent methyltransferase [Anaerolineae bacterium]|nr:class I SAM-dependent methyltransferase [Anaerolineae bacterium]
MPSLLDHFRIVAPLYDRIFSYDGDDDLKEHLRLPRQGWLLDAGGGTGRVAQTLRDLTGQVVILDESEGMLRQARGKGLIAVRGEVEALPFRSSAFPRILTVDTFHHLRDQAAAAGELMRALAAEGRIVVQEPDIRHRGVKLIALGEKILLMRSHFRTPQVVQRMFEAHDARVSVRQEGPHFWLIAEKESKL